MARAEGVHGRRAGEGECCSRLMLSERSHSAQSSGAARSAVCHTAQAPRNPVTTYDPISAQHQQNMLRRCARIGLFCWSHSTSSIGLCENARTACGILARA